jgi:hypothetical protein
MTSHYPFTRFLHVDLVCHQLALPDRSYEFLIRSAGWRQSRLIRL